MRCQFVGCTEDGARVTVDFTIRGVGAPVPLPGITDVWVCPTHHKLLRDGKHVNTSVGYVVHPMRERSR